MDFEQKVKEGLDKAILKNLEVINDLLSKEDTAPCAQTQIAISNLNNLCSIKFGYFPE